MECWRIGACANDANFEASMHLSSWFLFVKVSRRGSADVSHDFDESGHDELADIVFCCFVVLLRLLLECSAEIRVLFMRICDRASRSLCCPRSQYGFVGNQSWLLSRAVDAQTAVRVWTLSLNGVVLFKNAYAQARVR